MIRIKQEQHSIFITLYADLINTSSQRFDLTTLKTSIVSQLMQVYNTTVGKYTLTLQVSVNVLYSINKCSSKHILFQIVDTIRGGNPAEADLKGLRIKLNKATVTDIIYNRNTRTIPHEIGHLFGWNHPHANATYESINLEAHALEQQLTEEERRHNLMSQGWYPQRTAIPLTDAMQLTEKQMELLFFYYNSNALNRNYHLTQFLFWKKLLD